VMVVLSGLVSFVPRAGGAKWATSALRLRGFSGVVCVGSQMLGFYTDKDMSVDGSGKELIMAGLSARDEVYTKPGVPDELKWQPVMRGFPEDMEVLTDVGWVLFQNLYRAGVNGLRGGGEPLFTSEVNWSQEYKPLRDNWQGNKTQFQLPYSFAHHNEIDYTKWVVGDSFPRLASLSPDHVVKGKTQHGAIVFVRPSYATRFTYEDLVMVRLKKRGLDVVLPRYTDVFVKNRFQSSWSFSVADDFCAVKKVEGAYKSVINRYTPAGSLFGDVDVERLKALVEAGELSALMMGEFPAKVMFGKKQASRERISDMFTYPEVRDPVTGKFMKNPQLRNSVECYNFVLPVGSSHTLVVRRAGSRVDGEKPRVSWVGLPVVAGDGYDKNLILTDRVQGAYS
jgi:hypothetical protein